MQLQLLCEAPPFTSSVEQLPELRLDTVRPGRSLPLPRLYYLQNFRFALDSLERRYATLLSGDERAFIREFTALPEPCQCLVARLLMRKGFVFPRESLEYPEVVNLQEALCTLETRGWVNLDPALTLEELFRVLKRETWRAAFGSAKPAAMAIDDIQMPLPLSAAPTETKPLSRWHHRLTGSHVQLLVEPLARRLQQLYFGNDYQTWAEFVLTDLGMQRFEQVPCSAASCAFTSRAEIEHFYRLNECRARFRNGEHPASVLADARPAEGGPDWLCARFARLQIRLGEQLEATGDTDLALTTYRNAGTIEAQISLIRLAQRQGRFADAKEVAEQVLHSPCSEVHRHALNRRLHRLRQLLGEKGNKPPPRPKVAALEISLPELRPQERVERRVCAVLNEMEGRTFYVENSLFRSLFGLLCWDAIYAPVPGAFFHPFQTGPADLYTSEFRDRRAAHFDALLALLDAGKHEAVIWRHHHDKAGIRNAFVHWGRITSPVLSLALACIPATHLKCVFERLLQDLEDHSNGFPDLIRFWPEEQRYQLIEVKAPGDRLQDNQRRWMEFFMANSVPAAVCNVRLSGTRADE